MPFLKEQKQKAKLTRNCLKCNSWVSKFSNFLGVVHHTPRGCPPPTPTPTWYCVPRWQPRHHFWSLLLPQLSWLFQTLTKTPVMRCRGLSITPEWIQLMYCHEMSAQVIRGRCQVDTGSKLDPQIVPIIQFVGCCRIMILLE